MSRMGGKTYVQERDARSNATSLKIEKRDGLAQDKIILNQSHIKYR